MSRFRVAQEGPDWVSLGEASRLLGVAPATVRRWSDSGQLPTFTTPGGHRRFRRTHLERLMPADRQARPSLARSGMTPARLARAYRSEARSSGRQMAWIYALSADQREWFRDHGRRLADALVTHLDSADDDVAARTLAVATSEAAEYGRKSAEIGVSLAQAVEGFLRFRQPFMHQLSLVARRRGFDAAGTGELLEDAERLLDRLVVAAMNGHSVQRVGQPTADPDEGLR